MIRRMSFGALALAIVLPMHVAAARAADDNLDKKVVEIVKKTGDLYKNAKTIHADGRLATTVDGDGDKKSMKATAVYDVAKPAQLAIRTKIEGDASKGPDVIADGKKLVVYRKAMKQYTEADQSDGLAEIGLNLLRPPLGAANVGMLFANILGDDPGDLLMNGVTACSYVGMDKVDGKPVHRMKFSQPEFDWELWVASEGKPYVLRMISIAKTGDNTITTTETYKNWKIEATPAKDAFTFTAPKDAKKVDGFEQPR
jgi:hypothetical protein